MAFIVKLDEAQASYPAYKFISALSPSAQKAAFHVQDSDGNDLCLKIISPDYEMDRLHREIYALEAMSHSNVARFVEYVFSSKLGKQVHYLIEEFIEGKDLSEYLKPGEVWTPKETAEFFASVSDGLSALQEKNLVHRDIKPSNIRVRPDRTPVIIDLGLARHLDLPDITQTSEGAAIGTPTYFAPEQFEGNKHHIDRRTDLFALGVLIFQALVGCHPFYVAGMSIHDLREAVCNSEEQFKNPRFTNQPKQWILLVKRLLEKQRGRRPHGPDQVAKILRKIGDCQ